MVNGKQVIVMNKDEYWQLPNPQGTFEYKQVHRLLNQWKSDNNITERCMVHHRDDTDETCDYNSKHYELWGLNEDGTFEYGKYVQFLTVSEHSCHHMAGEKHPLYGKHHTNETREIMSEVHKGKTISDACKQKISDAMKGRKFSEEHKQKISDAMKGKPKPKTEETRHKISERQKAVSDLWKLYKMLHPESTMTFNEFQHSLKNNAND